MQQSLTTRSSDPFGRYYTTGGVAHLLVEAMALSSPQVVIDLGAGDGALIGAARRHWADARFIAVDVDRNTARSCLQKKGGFGIHHHVCDALDKHLPRKIGLDYESADSALCNPPFIRPKWQKHFDDILDEAGLSGVVNKIGAVQADILFIAQNLRFLRSGGKLGLIVPDGIIAGEKCGKLRTALTRAHHVERVIELPRGIFRNTDAKTHIVVLTKHRSPADTISIQQLQVDGSLSPAIYLPTEDATLRLDYSNLASKSQQSSGAHRDVCLRDVSETVTRGSYSSTQRHQSKVVVFHTCDLPKGRTTIPRRFSLTKGQVKRATGVLARTGDILVARVGRNLEEKVCVVTRGSTLITDCFFLIRVRLPYRQATINYLTGKCGKEALKTAAHGVGAKFITAESLLNLRVPI